MSVPYTASAAAQWTGGELIQGDAACVLESTSIDTRSVEAGALFVAIVGPRHDAHAFLGQAVVAGARALVVEKERIRGLELPPGVSVVACDDTTRALGAIAAGHRAGFSGPLLGITGSSGKTTTKEMAAAVFGAAGPCLKTLGNLNNDYGLPLTLLRRTAEHENAVIELGMNQRGEIARLAAIAQPTAALITNIGVAHIENLGSREEIAAEKGDLFAALDASGVAIANFDDPMVAEQAKRATGRVLSYARDAKADVRASDVQFLSDGRFVFELETPNARCQIELAGLSETTVINALAAAAAGVAIDLPLDVIQEGLAHYEPASGRMTRHGLAGDVTLIDDTYNANPVSLRAALESLAALSGEGRGIAVLGDMGELGDTAPAAHREAGRSAAELGIDYVFAIGAHAELIVSGATDAGLAGDRVFAGDDAGGTSEVIDLLLRTVRPCDWVLVKGSRAMRMERIVHGLIEAKGGASCSD